MSPKPEIQKAVEESRAQKGEDKTWRLPNDVRVNRATETIKALPFLSGGAKQTLHLTDVTPKFVVLAVIKGGNHLFMNIAAQDPNNLINVNTLREVITDYKDEILSDIFIGRQEGFQVNLKTSLEELKNALAETKTIHLSSPKQAAVRFTEEIPKHID